MSPAVRRCIQGGPPVDVMMMAQKLLARTILRPLITHGARQNVRIFSGDVEGKLATFADVKDADKSRTLLIDVREPQELKDDGVLPNSINIPLGQIERAFALPNEEFKRSYGCAKPDIASPIIFSCKKGIRSDTAMRTVEKFGYNNVRNYKGGWLDWAEQMKK